jgi:hypothetical protein
MDETLIWTPALLWAPFERRTASRDTLKDVLPPPASGTHILRISEGAEVKFLPAASADD